MSIPTQDYRRTDHRVPSRPFSGLNAAVNGVIGRHQRRKEVGEQLKRDAEAIDSQARDWMDLADHDLQTRLLGFRDQFRRTTFRTISDLTLSSVTRWLRSFS